MQVAAVTVAANKGVTKRGRDERARTRMHPPPSAISTGVVLARGRATGDCQEKLTNISTNIPKVSLDLSGMPKSTLLTITI